MLTIGAMMSDALWHTLVESADEFEIDVLHLGTAGSYHSSETGNLVPPATLSGVLVELSTELLRDSRNAPALPKSVPVAGLPTSPDALDIATAAGISTIIHGPEHLTKWLRTLTTGAEFTDQPGRIIAVWGPAGAPGRTTMAITVAAELALHDPSVILVDADCHAPAISMLLSVGTDTQGILHATRMARVEGVDATALLGATVHYEGGRSPFRIMTGMKAPERFVDVGSSAWQRVLVTLREAGHTVVVDLASGLERTEHEVMGGVIRNALSIVTLENADEVMVVVRPTALSVARLARAWPRLLALAPQAHHQVFFMAVSPAQKQSRDEAAYALWRFSSVEEVIDVPRDSISLQRAENNAMTLGELPSKSAILGAIAPYVRRLQPPRTVAGKAKQTAHQTNRWVRWWNAVVAKRLP
jgi:MinD-like ATPase involved in chromosome partitioning or flagellar assembly